MISIFPILTAVAAIALLLSIAVRRHLTTKEMRRTAEHSISSDELYELLRSSKGVSLYDIRHPLDVLTDAEMIPGAKRISPSEVMANPSLLPKDEESVVYCTTPGEESSRRVLRAALAMGFSRVRFLKGGIAAWKAKGYPVEPVLERAQVE